MTEIVSRLDIPRLFWDVDDYCRCLEARQQTFPQLPSSSRIVTYRSRLSLSEVMTIAIAFHGSDHRTFKGFYTHQVLRFSPVGGTCSLTWSATPALWNGWL